jgi:hypothetical protein
MPFLIPAFVALICDICIVWLNRLAPSEPLYNNSTGTSDENYSNDTNVLGLFSLYNVNYLAPLAGLRLVILIIPLLFHSYTGKAVRYMLFYKCLYSVSLAIISIHMIALALLNPTSMEAIFPNLLSTNYNNDDNNNSNNTTSSSLRQLLEYATASVVDHHRYLLDHLLELRRIWWMLTLSLVSVCCHWILLWHVRSTAPSYYLGSYRKPSVYFAVRTASSYANANTQHHNNDPNIINNNHSSRSSNMTNSTTASIVNEQALIHAMNGTFFLYIVLIFAVGRWFFKMY